MNYHVTRLNVTPSSLVTPQVTQSRNQLAAALWRTRSSFRGSLPPHLRRQLCPSPSEFSPRIFKLLLTSCRNPSSRRRCAYYWLAARASVPGGCWVRYRSGLALRDTQVAALAAGPKVSLPPPGEQVRAHFFLDFRSVPRPGRVLPLGPVCSESSRRVSARFLTCLVAVSEVSSVLGSRILASSLGGNVKEMGRVLS